MTGRDLITASLRLIGALAPGESLAAQEATDGLASINRMIDSWSNEGLIIHAITAEAPLTLTPGTATVTMGTGGNITTRPMEIVKAVIRDGSTDQPPMCMLTVEQYAAISDKSAQSVYPHSLYDDGGFPRRTLTLYPVPSAAKSLVLYTKRALTQIATLDTSLSLPPGYERALVANGALELAPEFGKQIDAMVMKAAEESKAQLKRSNYRPGYLGITDIPAGQGGGFDIMTGGYR